MPLWVAPTALSASHKYSGTPCSGNSKKSFGRQGPFTLGTIHLGAGRFPYPSGSAVPVLEDWNETEQQNKMTQGWEGRKYAINWALSTLNTEFLARAQLKLSLQM